jgi:hypothetical protein
VATEVARLGIADATRELEAWFDAPQAYGEPHARRMIETLVALGNEARKQGDVLSAAGDYNRALAHAPDDPQLLRIVAAMSRDEARARFLRRAAVALTLMLGLAAVTFGVGRFVRARTMAGAAPAPGGASAVVLPPPVVVPTFPHPVDSVAPSATAPARVTAVTPAPRDTSPRVLERTFTLNLHPTMGVKLSVDGEAQRAVSTGWTLPLDTKAHLLTFSCDVCATPVQRAIAPGERDDTLTVTVPIKPAMLNVQGDVKKTYQIVEDPQLSIRAGANSIPLASQFRSFTVRQVETDVRERVRVEAGQTTAVLF